MRKNLKLVIITSVALFWLACVAFINYSSQPQAAAASSALPATVKAEQVAEIAGYRNWTRVNPEPVNMDPAVAALCAAPNLGKPVGASPHLHKFITVYVNEIGRRAMTQERKPDFPVGSVIVKEKLASRDSAAPELLTVMIKREKDFNRESGDWEYMVTDGEGQKVEARGKLASCQSCHAGVSEQGYVFRNYLTRDARKSLR